MSAQKAEPIENADKPDAVTKNVTMAGRRSSATSTAELIAEIIVPSKAIPAAAKINSRGA